MSEIKILYLNQAYQTYKDNKNIYCCDFFIIGQVIPFLNPPKNLSDFEVKSNEAKIIRPKYDVVSGQFLGLVGSLGYLAVLGDKSEIFLDYGYSKKNSSILYSTHKNKIPKSFSGTIFRQHNIQYEAGAFFDS